MRKATLRDRISYRVDHFMAWNPIVKVLGLMSVVLGVVFVSAMLKAVLHVDGSFLTLLSGAYINLLDPTSAVDSTTAATAAIALSTSVTGMVFVALLIGLVTDGVSARVEALNKGASRVIEHGHTVILGWNDRLIPLLRELIEANRSAGGRPIAILAHREKVDMEEDIKDAIRDFKGSRIVCRTGSTAGRSDLERVSVDAARAIIVLSEEVDPDEADATAIRTVLALRETLMAGRAHAVVEVSSPDTRALIQGLSNGKVEAVIGHSIVGRLMIQSARQPGLAQVYEDLLSFDGDEFYFKHWPSLVGKTFGEAVRCFPAAVACGIRRASGALELNPPDEAVFGAGDELLVVAADDDSYQPAEAYPTRRKALPNWAPPARPVEHHLFCGWRTDMREIVRELDSYVTKGTTLAILATQTLDGREELLDTASLKNLKIEHFVGSPWARRDLAHLPLERFDSVLVLVDDSLAAAGAREMDSRNLVSLLLIRELQSARGRPDTLLISEIRDPATKELVAVARLSDFVMSSAIVSKYLVQVAEQQGLAAVWADLMDAHGNEIYLKDVRHYVGPAEQLSFWELSDRARMRREVALGYRSQGRQVINPKDKAAPLTLGEGDLAIVIAEEG